MKNNFEIIKKSPLFNDIEPDDLHTLLDCLSAETKSYKKGQTILTEGQPAKYIGIIISGGARVEHVDYYGNRSIVSDIAPPNIFGESFACAQVSSLPVNIIASEDADIMLIDARHITVSCSNACGFHSRLVFNLLKIVAAKNLVFHQKTEITSKRTTREKLMTYLLIQAKKYGKDIFSIPFNRQELADYLEVDRSGLSAEISKLRSEGVLECKRNTFRLLN